MYDKIKSFAVGKTLLLRFQHKSPVLILLYHDPGHVIPNRSTIINLNFQFKTCQNLSCPSFTLLSKTKTLQLLLPVITLVSMYVNRRNKTHRSTSLVL